MYCVELITILTCCSIGLKTFEISVDYQDYMGSSLETWLLRQSFLHLNSYNLVGSVTADIRVDSALNTLFVYLK